MPSLDLRLQRSIDRIAAVLALLVALSLPAIYGALAYWDARDDLQFKARVKAAALSSLIASAPDTWTLAENRIQGLMAREPVPFDNELVEVLDLQGEIVASTGQPPPKPTLRISQPLYDADRVVGNLAVTRAMGEALFTEMVVALVGVMLGLLIYAIMKTLPLRALSRVTRALHEEKERAETTLHSIGDAVITTDAEARVNYLNPVAERLLALNSREVRGRRVTEIIHLQDATEGTPLASSLDAALQQGTVVSCQGNGELRRCDGTRVAVEERAAPILDSEGKLIGGVVVLRDVTVTREYLHRQSWEATHDPLTALFNRREFERRLKAALEDVQENRRSHALCYMDLDRFKVVNDACGHAAGDELLRKLSELMQKRIRDTDTLARLGGDEFGVLLENCPAARGKLIAEEILAAVNEFQFLHSGKTFTVGISIGLTEISPTHTSVAEILGEADCACYWAKDRGKNRVLIFAASDMSLAARRAETGWVARINAALRDNRFVLYGQRYKTMETEAGHGEHLEVLLRMIGEDGELILPGRFLPAAERYNLMPQIDRWVIQEVFSHYADIAIGWGGQPITCAINLSGASLDSEELLPFVQKQATRYKLHPGSICFELTETVAIQNLQAAAEFIQTCKELGFQFALDDFGTGTSSFGYLKNLPVDYLKIDGSFVKNIEHDSVDHAMVETINRIGHILGKRTVAECAETEGVIGRLASIGVDFAQGFGYACPEPLLPNTAK